MTATVTNTDSHAGDNVVFLHLSDPVASIAQPAQRLRGFQRVSLAPGTNTTIHFTLSPQDLGFWNDRDELIIETGELLLSVTDGTTRHDLTLTVI